MSASTVAPAQVGPAFQPIIAASAAIPTLNSQIDPTLILPEPLTSEAAEAAAQPLSDEDVSKPSDEIVTAPAKPTGSLASMVAQLRGSEPGSRELECLAVGIYFESKSEPLIGQLAVGEVIANRATSGRFASTYCGVLFQRGQFSFIRGKSLPKVPRAGKQWQTAVAIAKIVDQDLLDSNADKALFFHAKRVSPRWRLKRVASIGNHIFYR